MTPINQSVRSGTVIKQKGGRAFQRFLTDTEFNQSLVRFPVAMVVSSYGFITGVSGFVAILGRQISLPVLATILYLLTAIGFSIAIFRWPGHFWGRRFFAMVIDYFACGFFLFLGSDTMAPVFAALVWVTVGNGLRYGRGYLMLAICFALFTAACVVGFNPYWRANPHLSVSFLLTILLVPGYAFALLSRASKAEGTAQRANAEKSSFLAQASHDLRQPIQTIGLLSAQLGNDKPASDVADIAVKIERAAHSASTMIQTFLDMSIIESGTLAAHAAPVRIGDIFDDVRRQNSADAGWSTVNLRLVNSDLVVMADPVFLSTMLQNIVANAIKFSAGGRVLIGCRRKGQCVSVYVCDTGSGIAPEHLNRISEAFFRIQSDDSIMVPGAGLGLSIVKRLAQLGGHNVDIDSKVGKGTTVSINDLPVTGRASATIFSKIDPAPGQLRGLRVILIEDDAATLQAATDLLANWGCEVAAYTKPPATAGNCDIVISDYLFADATTLGSYKAFLVSVEAHKASLIVITGNDLVDVQRAMKRTKALFAAKPVRPAELRSILMSVKLARAA